MISALRLLAFLLCLVPASQAAEVYKWTDPDGRVVYSDEPPAESGPEAETLDIEIPSLTAPPSVEWQAPADDRGSAGTDKTVILYSTAWCAVCRRAKDYFARQGIRYTEYDVETSVKGRRDYRRLKGRGVPIILVGGNRMNGFSEQAFERLLANAD